MKKELGQALIFILILLGVGAVLTVAYLNTTYTIVTARQIYGQFINEDYAADAAVEYGMWRLKYEPGFAEKLPIGTESPPFYVTLNGVTANATILAQALEVQLSGQNPAGRAGLEEFFKVEKSVIATATFATLAADDFESGDGEGGTGAWTDNWTLQGDASITTSELPHEGFYHLRLLGDNDANPGDGYARRQVDLSSHPNAQLRFWAKMNDFETEDYVDVRVSTNLVEWNTLRTFVNGEDDNTYRSYTFDLSGYGGPSTFYIAFDAGGLNKTYQYYHWNYDYFYVDDVEIIYTEATAQPEPGVLTEYTYYVSLQCIRPDG
jgi:hypothetical protein